MDPDFEKFDTRLRAAVGKEALYTWAARIGINKVGFKVKELLGGIDFGCVTVCRWPAASSQVRCLAATWQFNARADAWPMD